jgi:hypothetical protein
MLLNSSPLMEDTSMDATVSPGISPQREHELILKSEVEAGKVPPL